MQRPPRADNTQIPNGSQGGVHVHKYGGSSLVGVQHLEALVQRTRATLERGARLVLVVSARGKTTDVLMRKGLRRGLRPYSRELDAWLSQGERESVACVTQALRAAGIRAQGLEAHALGLHVTAQPGRARVLGLDPHGIQEALQEQETVVVPGFLGTDAQGALRTLGRGGSDWTALALAHVLQAPCSIFTDVEGVYTADPKHVKEAQQRPTLSHAALLALARSGAQVMQTRAMMYAQAHAVPFTIGAALGQGSQTRILTQAPSPGPIWGVALHRRQAYVKLSGLGSDSCLPAELFQALSTWELFIDLFWQSAQPKGLEMAFTLDYDELPLLTHCLQSAFGALKAQQLTVTPPIAKLSILQAKDTPQPPLDARFLKGLEPLRTLALPDRLVVCLPQHQALHAYRCAHKAFFA